MRTVLVLTHERLLRLSFSLCSSPFEADEALMLQYVNYTNQDHCQPNLIKPRPHSPLEANSLFFFIFPFFNFKYLISKDVFFSPQDFVVVFFNPCLVCSS